MTLLRLSQYLLASGACGLKMKRRNYHIFVQIEEFDLCCYLSLYISSASRIFFPFIFRFSNTLNAIKVRITIATGTMQSQYPCHPDVDHVQLIGRRQVEYTSVYYTDIFSSSQKWDKVPQYVLNQGSYGLRLLYWLLICTFVRFSFFALVVAGPSLPIKFLLSVTARLACFFRLSLCF